MSDIDQKLEERFGDGAKTRKSFANDCLYFLGKGMEISTHKRAIWSFSSTRMILPYLKNPVFRTMRCAAGVSILGAVGAGTGLIAAGLGSAVAAGALLGTVLGVTRHVMGVVAQAIVKDTYHRGTDTDHHYATATLFKPVGWGLAWALPGLAVLGTYKGLEAVYPDYPSAEKTTQIETTKRSLQTAFAQRVAFSPIVDVKPSAPNFKGYTYRTVSSAPELKL